jgi:glycosyltransferase involved in cell wall biosynthesis
MTALPTITVIITTYNSPADLRRVLAAYLEQTLFPMELVVADDGSTGETAAVVEEFRRTAPFPVKHVWHEDLGFRAAKIRNEAIKVSLGEYLLFSDGDCLPHHAFVADHAALAKPGYFVQGKRMLVRKQAAETFAVTSGISLLGQCLAGNLSGAHHLLRIPGFALEGHGLRGIKTCNFALYRTAAVAVNGFNESFVGWGREDSEFAARLLVSGLKRHDPPFSALVFHLWHPENSRDFLAENDRMLADAIAAQTFRCSCGIVDETVASAGLDSKELQP